MRILAASIIALRSVIYLMEVILVIRVICEFKLIRRDSPFFRFLLGITDPLLYPVRKLLIKHSKDKSLRFDLSPLFVIIFLYLVNLLLRKLI